MDIHRGSCVDCNCGFSFFLFNLEEALWIKRKQIRALVSDDGALNENHVVRSPGFGPGFLPWQGNVLDQARLRPLLC